MPTAPHGAGGIFLLSIAMHPALRVAAACAAISGGLLLLNTGFTAGTAHSQSAAPAATGDDEDAALVRLLLDKDLGNRRFRFATVARACSGKLVLPLDREAESHRRMLAHIENALAETLREHNRSDSPVRSLRRINEASRHFEDGLMRRLDAIDGLACTPAPTRAGTLQRAGYPDLRLIDEATGTVFYLDPKLVQSGSETSTLRTFYFEPKTDTLKITDDAVHLILGITHDGIAGQWTFQGWRVVCLANLQVRLKAEFQASNADLYRDCGLSIPPDAP